MRSPSPSNTGARAAIILIVAVGMLAWTVAEGGDGPVPESAAERLELSLRTPTATIEAGATTELEVASTGPAEAVEVLVISAAGSTTSTVDLVDGVGRLIVGAPHTTRAGRITVGLTVGDAPRFETLDVVPGHAEDLDINVGPTSVRRTEVVMAVGLITDVWGNPVDDGTAIRASISGPQGGTTVVELETQRGLGVVEFPAADIGVLAVAMDAAPIHSPALDVTVRADPPLPFDLLHDSTEPLVADARRLVELRSTLLADANGAVVADGTLVDVEVDGPDGVGVIQGEVIDGVVHARLVAPTRPGRLTATASVQGTVGTPLVLDFAAALDTFPVGFELVEGQRHAVIGPVVGSDGGLLADGTPVRIGDLTLYLDDGRARIVVPPGSSLPPVTVLGIEGEIT